MSLLAGFDFIFEVRRNKLLDLLQENMTVQGNSLDTPFRLVLPGPASGSLAKRQNAVDLLVSSVNLALEPGTNLCRLKLGLDGGVIRLDGEPDAAFRGGEISIRIELVNTKLLFAKPKEATFSASPSPVMEAISNFAARADTEINKLINDERDKEIPLLPDAPSTLTVPLSIGGINQCLDAETVCSCRGSGNIADVSSALNPGSSIALAFSADIVKRFILCRAILNPSERDKDRPDTFGEPSEAEKEKLPMPCGVGVISRGPITITRFDFTFRDGFIDIDGDFHGDDDCWEVTNGRFSQQLSMTLAPAIGSAPARFISKLEPETPRLSYSLEIKWYCLLGVAVGTVLQNAVFPLASTLGATWMDFMLKAINNATPETGPTVPSQPATTFGNIAWREVAISTEGLLLIGDRIGGIVSQIKQAAIHIQSQQTPQNLVATGSGPVTGQAPTCARKCSITSSGYRTTSMR